MTDHDSDIKLFFVANGRDEWADIKKEEGDFVRDGGLETAILMSLFVDQRVREEDSETGETRGFWAENLIGYNMGSKLWLLDRSKITNDTLRLYEQYVKEALAWMIDENIIRDVSAEAVRNGNRISCTMTVYRPEGDVSRYKFYDKWATQVGG